MTGEVRRSKRADIIGSGPAGLALAIALGRRGWAVTVLAAPPANNRSSRIDVLGGSAAGALARLGISRDDLQKVASPCPGTWSRWDAGASGGTDFMTTPHGHAWAIERPRFEGLLLERAIEAGVVVMNGEAGQSRSPEKATARRSGLDGDADWRIIAFGGLPRRAGPRIAHVPDDHLIALVGVATFAPSVEPIDRRLLIEAGPDGWAYSIVGPRNRLCVGIITDAESLAVSRPDPFARALLARTERICGVFARLSCPLKLHAAPVPCRWLPVQSDRNTVRVGDAQASFDPLAGRGLWNAMRSAEEIAAALDADPARLDEIDRRSRQEYRRYLTERLAFYRAGRDRFATGFWRRRCLAAPSGSWTY